MVLPFFFLPLRTNRLLVTGAGAADPRRSLAGPERMSALPAQAAPALRSLCGDVRDISWRATDVTRSCSYLLGVFTWAHVHIAYANNAIWDKQQ